MTILEETGRNIVLLRTALGITQEEAAFRSNLSVSRYQDIERGCSNTTLDSLTRIAETFQVDFRVLGTFTRPDKEILSEVQNSSRRLPEQPVGGLPIYENIVLLRREKRLTQVQLARKSNISPARLRDIEHGCANATIHTLACLANGFGMSLLGLAAVTMTEDELWEIVRRARDMVGIRVS